MRLKVYQLGCGLTFYISNELSNPFVLVWRERGRIISGFSSIIIAVIRLIIPTLETSMPTHPSPLLSF